MEIFINRIEHCWCCGEIIYRTNCLCHLEYYLLDEVDRHSFRNNEEIIENDRKPSSE